MDKKVFKPEGWTFNDDDKFLMADEKEDEYHTNGHYYNDPEGKFGAAKVGSGLKSSFGGEDEGRDTPEGTAVRDAGQIDIPSGHKVVEQGHQNYRNYYLVRDEDNDKFYVVIPNVKEGKEYRGPKRSLRAPALEDAFKVLNVSLPESVLAQLRMRSPESEIPKSL